MADTIVLKNISFRVVGAFMRVNQPYTAVPSPTDIPFSITIPELEVNQPPTVGAVMDALRTVLPNYVDPRTGNGLPIEFKFGDLQPPTRPGTLDFISFEVSGIGEYRLSAEAITKAVSGVSKGALGEQLGVAWQYYVFGKDETNRDQRIEVSGRARYRESVMIQDNYRIIWRLITTYLNPNNGAEKTDVKQNDLNT